MIMGRMIENGSPRGNDPTAEMRGWERGMLVDTWVHPVLRKEISEPVDRL